MTTSLFSDEPPPCPHCGDGGPLPIVYSSPSEEMRTAAQLGQIFLAPDPGHDQGPQWVCRNVPCAQQF